MTQYTGMEIAIIGMAGTFPGADSVDEFWENIKNGVDSVSTFSAEELVEEGIDRESIDHPDYVKCRQVVQGKEFFDSSFFDYLPNEAALMDPQMRVFHQTVWEGLEDAGYTSEGFNGLIGLYAGNSSNFDWEAAARMSEAAQAVDGFTAMQLTGRDFLTTRVAHKLNLKGPALFLQTACSTSLVAVHTACRALLTGDCHIAVAGGVKIDYNFKKGYLFQEGMIGSPDGHCRAFDAKAKGTVGSEGSAVVVLKKLKKALADRDYIYAVIKGSGINNDGLRKVGYTAPSVDGQADAIRMAYKVGRVEPQSISYVEAHGTATALGDPIEAEALIAVFGKDKEKTCGLGSVKSNVGHMDSAAGVGGLIKTALALKHKLMPPSLYFENPNPAIDFVNSPFYVNTALKEWTGKSPLRAGVSSFGIGGTNAHAILEEAPQPEPAAADRLYKLLPFSAKSAGALERLTAKLGTFFKKNTDCHLADAAYTLQVGREAFNHRSVLVCQDGAEAARKLAAGDFKTFSTKKEKKQVVFMFPGQGSQYVNMARGLYETEPLFRQEMDNCFELIADASGGSATRTGIIPSAGSAKGRRP
ncbi:MAG: type I polyketide synthase, partial [bacterium]|nr:type I polyketide synthase [bacterium]